MRPNRKNNPFNVSADINDKTFINFYDQLMEIAINMFEWKNLPDSCDERFLELVLYANGMCLFFEDEVLGYLTLQTMIEGPLDVYRVPINRRAYAANGYNKFCTKEDSVIIFNNRLRTPSMLAIEQFAMRLYEVQRAIDVNVKQQKTPCMILCDESQQLTMKNLFMKYDGNQPFIFGDRSLDLTGISALRTDAPFVSDKLQALKRQIWAEALTFLGVETNVNDKRERLVSDEIRANVGGVEAQRFTKLNARREAAEKINQMFGLDIEVEFRQELNVSFSDTDGTMEYNVDSAEVLT